MLWGSEGQVCFGKHNHISYTNVKYVSEKIRNIKIRQQHKKRRGRGGGFKSTMLEGWKKIATSFRISIRLSNGQRSKMTKLWSPLIHLSPKESNYRHTISLPVKSIFHFLFQILCHLNRKREREGGVLHPLPPTVDGALPKQSSPIVTDTDLAPPKVYPPLTLSFWNVLTIAMDIRDLPTFSERVDRWPFDSHEKRQSWLNSMSRPWSREREREEKHHYTLVEIRLEPSPTSSDQ